MKWTKEYLLKLRERMLGEQATPDFIARGWSIGMFYGCVIPFGFQLLLSIPTAIVMKASRVGATLGTLITNHFTIFIIYPVQCWVGNRLLGGDLSYATIMKAMENVIAEQSWQSILQLTGELMAAFLVGGFLLAAICVPLTYFGVLRYVEAYRAKKAQWSARGQFVGKGNTVKPKPSLKNDGFNTAGFGVFSDEMCQIIHRSVTSDSKTQEQEASSHQRAYSAQKRKEVESGVNQSSCVKSA